MGGRGGLPRCLKVNQQPQPPSTDDSERNMGAAIIPLCQHRMNNATRCGCPAMRGRRYCCTHQREQARRAKKTAERARQRWFESAPLEDVASVRRALMQVMTRLVSGSIAYKQAGQILYKLQTASVNLRSPASDPRKA